MRVQITYRTTRREGRLGLEELIEKEGLSFVGGCLILLVLWGRGSRRVRVYEGATYFSAHFTSLFSP